MVANGVRVVRAGRWEDYLGCEELQRTARGPPDGAAVPAGLLRSLNEHGGLLLMALIGDLPVGLVLGHPALQGRALHHHSDLVLVMEGYRHQGVGFMLRRRQREEVLAQGLERITWTLDPLQADHSNLTFRKLGAYAEVYLGEPAEPRGGNLPGGPPADRLAVEWRLEDPGVLARLQGGNLTAWEPHGEDTINTTAPLPGGCRESIGANLRLHSPQLFLEVPWDLQPLGREHPDATMAWRKEVREALEHYFARRYRITDFALDRKYRRAFLVLTCAG
jgi:predicted GNAT superfamily acetyltransferase